MIKITKPLLQKALIAGFFSAFTIGVLTVLTYKSTLGYFLAGSFGSSMVLLFGFPRNSFADLFILLLLKLTILIKKNISAVAIRIFFKLNIFRILLPFICFHIYVQFCYFFISIENTLANELINFITFYILRGTISK